MSRSELTNAVPASIQGLIDGGLLSRHEKLFRLVDEERIVMCGSAAAAAALRSVDFNSAARKGRGDEYRRSQQSSRVRIVGIEQLFRFVRKASDKRSQHGSVYLDILGGDGTLARAFHNLFPDETAFIVTSDLSVDMVAGAIRYGLPAIRQSAASLVLRDESVDGALIAYGTHHIWDEELALAVAEVHRVLEPGGRVVIHDFLEESPVAVWFQQVVHHESRTGHNFSHFRRGDLKRLLENAEFREVREELVYDPFVMAGRTRAGAEDALATHLLNMYGLEKMVVRLGHKHASATCLNLAAEIFRYNYSDMELPAGFGQPTLTISLGGGCHWIELPRVAVVAHAIK